MQGLMTTSADIQSQPGTRGAGARSSPPAGDARDRGGALSPAGIATAVLEAGEGPPLLLLHGPGGYRASRLRVIPELAPAHRVIAPDLPGHGASSPPTAPSTLIGPAPGSTT